MDLATAFLASKKDDHSLQPFGSVNLPKGSVLFAGLSVALVDTALTEQCGGIIKRVSCSFCKQLARRACQIINVGIHVCESCLIHDAYIRLGREDEISQWKQSPPGANKKEEALQNVLDREYSFDFMGNPMGIRASESFRDRYFNEHADYVQLKRCPFEYCDWQGDGTDAVNQNDIVVSGPDGKRVPNKSLSAWYRHEADAHNDIEAKIPKWRSRSPFEKRDYPANLPNSEPLAAHPDPHPHQTTEEGRYTLVRNTLGGNLSDLPDHMVDRVIQRLSELYPGQIHLLNDHKYEELIFENIAELFTLMEPLEQTSSSSIESDTSVYGVSNEGGTAAASPASPSAVSSSGRVKTLFEVSPSVLPSSKTCLPVRPLNAHTPGDDRRQTTSHSLMERPTPLPRRNKPTPLPRRHKPTPLPRRHKRLDASSSEPVQPLSGSLSTPSLFQKHALLFGLVQTDTELHCVAPQKEVDTLSGTQCDRASSPHDTEVTGSPPLSETPANPEQE